MQIVVFHPKPSSAARWRDALAKVLPPATVTIWREGARGDARYAVTSGAPAQLFQDEPQLQALFATGAGVERLLASEALPATLPIVRLEDAGMAAQMASYCIGETLAWMRHADEYAAQQRTRTWKQLSAEELSDWPIGVFGLGTLGRRVAEAFAALGFTVCGYSRSRPRDAPFECFAESDGPDAFAAFLRSTRVLILLAPLTPATQDRFDRAALTHLPRGAYIINVARGGLLVEDALLEQLDSGRLAGAALDVFREASVLVPPADSSDAARFGADVDRAFGSADRGEDSPPRARRADLRRHRSRPGLLAPHETSRFARGTVSLRL
jgi:glyoxylate/hydroxypyruvate reductase A